jgi:very-short-patch-repair endonuclease
LRDDFAGFAPDIKIPVGDVVSDFEARRAEVLTFFPRMSVPEFIVWQWLVDRKRWSNGDQFIYQLPLLGGRTIFGGFVVDFYIRPGNMAWNIQGLRYHLEQPAQRGKVLIQSALLAQRGYRVVSLWEDDLVERPNFTIEAALRGEDTNRHKDEVGLS